MLTLDNCVNDGARSNDSGVGPPGALVVIVLFAAIVSICNDDSVVDDPNIHANGKI